MTDTDVSRREQPNPGSIEVRSLVAGGLLLLVLFLVLLAALLGVRPFQTLGGWLGDPLPELTASLAAVVAVLCLLRWRVAADTQALRIGLAMALYGGATLVITDVGRLASGSATTTSTLAALHPLSRLAVIALLGHALVMAPTGAWPEAARALLLTLVPLVVLSALLHASPVPDLGDALPGVMLFGLGVTYTALGVQEGRHLFAWTGLMLVGLAFAELTTAVPVLAGSISSLNALCPAALMLGGLGGYRDIQQAFAAQRNRMLASHVTALNAAVLARDLRAAQEERAHEATSALLAIEGATGTLERERDLLDGDARQALTGALQAEINRLRTLLDQEPAAQRLAPFTIADALAPAVVCANAGGMRVRCAIAPDLQGFGDAAHVVQVVQQLLVNADRHAPGSPVEVTATSDGDSVIVRVADRGPGVACHLRDRIFERGHCSTASAQAGGRGFGLAIARQLIDSQGGALWYQDRPGGGACFTLLLRAAHHQARCVD